MGKMAIKVLSVLLTYATLISVISGKNIPSVFKPCPRNSPDVNVCFKEQVESFKQFVSTGIPEINIPPLDPLFLPQIIVDQGAGSVNLKATFKDVHVYGAKSYIVNDSKVDLKKPSFVTEVKFPSLRVEGDYDINGKVLVVPLNGRGKFNGNFTNISASVVINGKIVTRNNKSYFDITGNKLSLKVGGLRIHFANLFNGNKQLSESTNAFLNENWRDILREINPIVEETIETILVQFMKKVLEAFSIDDLFPAK